ncbi:MAG: hypothetical protein IIZ98_06500, partial [Erysipelotrichaceae bacterium]|nr:hypothetical protein [Erysipelotrichaceae bacterium]
MIGIIVAMALEREAIQQHLEDYRCVNYGRQNYYIGTISGRDVTLAECGVGKVASAITATRLIEHFGCDEIINPNLTGVNPDTWTDEYDWVYRCKFRAQDPKLPSRLR